MIYTFFWEVKKNGLIYAKVNKYEMQNSKFGTQDNLINVFSARGYQNPFTEVVASNQHPEGQKVIIDTSIKQYEYNVYMYLTYIMPKEEFEKRFEQK